MTDLPPQDPFGQQGGTPPPPPPPPPQHHAPQPGQYYASQGPGQAHKTDPFSVTSMVTGIVSVPLICCWPIAVILAIIATVFGALSINKIKKANGALVGRGMAIAGLVLGVCVLVAVVAIIIIAASSGNLEFNTYSNS